MSLISIVFQNADLIVLDKPVMVLSTPSRQGVLDARPVLGIELEKFLAKQVFPVHRLDFEVSGLILYALNAQAHKLANSWFEKRRIHKVYRATTTGRSFDHLPPGVTALDRDLQFEIGNQVVWKNKILRGKKRSYYSPHGDISETLAVYLGEMNGRHRWELQPVTGRSHQLRLDLSSRGYPILGDELYGSKEKLDQSGIALRCVELRLNEILATERCGLPEIIKVSE